MKNTIMRLIFASMLVIALAFVLASCGEEPHVHNWGEWQPVEGEEATCVDDGKEFRVCADDPTHTETRDVEATGKHNLAGEYISAPGGHWQLCSVCGEREEVLAHESAGPATTESAELCKYCGYELSPKLHPFTDKKILVIGNSNTYFGNVVIEKTQSIQKQTSRDNDKGYLYQAFLANGANVNVTNWTYGGHTLGHLFYNCTANRGCDGHDHAADLVDRNFDYVVIQPGTGANEETAFERINYVMNLFREANPDVKFILLMQHTMYQYPNNYTWKSSIKNLEAEDVTIVDWGRLVWDLMNNCVSVPGATQSYDKYSFVIAKSASDGYHPSPLSGYITAQMIYCAITGESAVGQDYSYCYNRSIDAKMNFDKYISDYYKVADTNFPEIFNSAADMRGIQQLIDQYLAEKAYRND